MRGAVLRSLAALLFACTGSPPPECPSPIPSQLAPSTMEPLWWSDENGCIEISYNPVFRDREQEVVHAVDQWIQIECKTTCFSAPVERATPDDGRPVLFSIHFAELIPMNGEESTTRLWFMPDDSRIDRALVKVNPVLDAGRFRRALLRGFGRGLGFETTMEVESVLDPSSELDALSANDVKAFCSKYGTCL